MKPIKEIPGKLKEDIDYILTDIDDTLSFNGRIPGCVYTAMERLIAAGIKVIPVSGRPAGWCDLIARMWPVHAVIGENGAFYFRYDEYQKKMIRRYHRTPEERRQDRQKLDKICEEILNTVPESIVSADQAYREADLAIDFCEDIPALQESDIMKIKRIFESHGAVAKISSIHVNGWFGNYDKLTMTKHLFQEVFSHDLETVKTSVLYAGDSPNDEPMFSFFPHSVGVANIMQFIDTMKHRPFWVTEKQGGYGFVQIVDSLLG